MIGICVSVGTLKKQGTTVSRRECGTSGVGGGRWYPQLSRGIDLREAVSSSLIENKSTNNKQNVENMKKH